MNAIVTICSDNYVKYTLVLIYSFFKNNEWFDGDFLILYDNVYTSLNDKNIQYLESLNNKIKCIKVDIKNYMPICLKYSKALFNSHYVCCSLKFEIFKLEYNKILFLDSDTLVLNSLKDLFLKDYSFAAIEDYGRSKNIHLRTNEYFNAGILYFGNNEYINTETLNNILLFALNSNNRYPFFEQDIFNEYFLNKQNVIIMDSTYNLPFNINNNLLLNNDWSESNIKIIHYWTKPSDYLNKYKAIQLWNDYKNEMKTNYETLGIHILL